MVTGTHPEDIDLFDYVEGDLRAPRAAEIEVHLASCEQCAEQVARVQAGRDVLRESQFLQLPPRRREGILLNLPQQRRERGRSPAPSPKRLLAILAPIAAVSAVIVALVSTGGNGTNQQAGATAGGVTGGGAAEKASGGGAELAPVLTVEGPAPLVADELRRKGFDARVVGSRVLVRDATRKGVNRALAHRRAGRVEIVIVP
jgi:anti-sigma factor RsiW